MAESEKMAVVEIHERASRPDEPTHARFFPWIKDEESHKAPLRDATSKPWLGILALTGSGCTSLLSLMVLLFIHNRAVWPDTGIYKLMQPASWLSALISINSTLLHIALTEGVTVAWWFKAGKPTTTVADLHDVWATGTSTVAAFQKWKKLNYVSLATLFVAILPINGFLLQGAISTPLSTVSKAVTIKVPMMKQLPLGYSGQVSGNNLIQEYASVWPTVFQQVQNLAGSNYAPYAYFGAYAEDFNTSTMGADLDALYVHANQSVFNFTALGAGFQYSCTPFSTYYDLQPAENETSRTGTVFSSSFGFNLSEPNELTLEVWWKSDTDCSGYYEGQRCVLKAATVEYPVQLQLDVSPSYPGPYYSLRSNSSYHDDKVVAVLPVYEQEGVHNTTYGGIWMSVNNWYASTVKLTQWSNGTWVTHRDGPLQAALNPTFEALDWQGCNLSFANGLDYVAYAQALNNAPTDPTWLGGLDNFDEDVDVAELVLNQIRRAMFLASVYAGSSWYSFNYQIYWNDAWSGNGGRDIPGVEADYVQTVPATRVTVTPIYHVRFYLWAASMAMTYLVILVILPTFWGYWVLVREPTMSPVDMARAFHAPVLNRAEDRRATADLLKEVGPKNIHRDLAAATAGPGPESRARSSPDMDANPTDLTTSRPTTAATVTGAETGMEMETPRQRPRATSGDL